MTEARVLHLDSEITPFSPRDEKLAWRAKLLELKTRHSDPADQAAIAEELTRVNSYLRQAAKDQ